jgi:hypothetical protein
MAGINSTKKHDPAELADNLNSISSTLAGITAILNSLAHGGMDNLDTGQVSDALLLVTAQAEILNTELSEIALMVRSLEGE